MNSNMVITTTLSVKREVSFSLKKALVIKIEMIHHIPLIMDSLNTPNI